MKNQNKRADERQTVLEMVRNKPGITAAEIPVKQRGRLRGLERDGLIECRGYGWYACPSDEPSKDVGEGNEIPQPQNVEQEKPRMDRGVLASIEWQSSRMAEFSNKVADALDGGIVPWRLSCMPRNVITNRPYGLINPIIINITATRLKLLSPYWGTQAQWNAFHCKVRKSDDEADDRATILLGKQENNPREGIAIEKGPGGVSAYHDVGHEPSIRFVTDFVYNLEQTDLAYPFPFTPPEIDLDSAFDEIVANAGVNIEYGNEATCEYIGSEDRIRMPHKCVFEKGPGGISAYYEALGHKLMIWSERRIGSYADPDLNELRADIGTGYLVAMLGGNPLSPDPAHQDCKNVGRWASLLRSDPEMLFALCENVTYSVGKFLESTRLVKDLAMMWYVFADDPQEAVPMDIGGLFYYLYDPQEPGDTPQQITQKLSTLLQTLELHKWALKSRFGQLIDRISKQPKISEKEQIFVHLVSDFLGIENPLQMRERFSSFLKGYARKTLPKWAYDEYMKNHPGPFTGQKAEKAKRATPTVDPTNKPPVVEKPLDASPDAQDPKHQEKLVKLGYVLIILKYLGGGKQPVEPEQVEQYLKRQSLSTIDDIPANTIDHLDEKAVAKCKKAAEDYLALHGGGNAGKK
jgi:antirestriction protein ArdC